ncbi:MAG: hypothetical protein ACOH1E_10565 [Brevundimonas sp.]
MKRLTLIGLALTVLLAGGVSADIALQPSHRIAAIAGLCKVGLPNLSRPPEVDARDLGCAVLGPKRRVTGFFEGGFEHSVIRTGDRDLVDGQGVINETAWFSDTSGLMQRGGETLRRLDHGRSDDCLVTVAKVTVDGWMTVSEGNFGHLGLAAREFYAYRIHSAEPARVEDLVEMWGSEAPICPAGGGSAGAKSEAARLVPGPAGT